MNAAVAPPVPEELDAFRRDRTYLGADHHRNERRIWIVTGICVVTLAAQLVGGALFKSVALTAGGLHMSAHVAALLTAAAAYAFARRHAADPRFSFGVGKVGYLAGFANAVVLAITALAIATESVERLIHPEAVRYDGALPLAAAGLAVNLLCIVVLRPARRKGHTHDRDGDLNISAAHLHLSADAMVSVLTIAAMALGAALHWDWTDPAAGLAGAILVGRFAWNLARRASATLLDVNPSSALTEEVRARLQVDGAEVVDLHVWRLGPGHHAAVAVVAGLHVDVARLRQALAVIPELSHVTIEVATPGATHQP
ncbi:CDF family Co(II)/Ni(II) efflux transporter DmeF [Phenylobacterium immobile]|uniref:CDF family Co(II)/Ni(II) efflux transporter DmeF n=1 Tax=Phenylobacterium immobile TaxID=21 RepID=UPI000B80370D|nr:CDF family Co(II)/Ni(II) efflux transporter DmeF [Phenylobacterium immobile]